MTNPLERRQALIDSLEQRVLTLDGAMGTMIHQAPLSIETDYLGRENCPEILNVTRPTTFKELRADYSLQAKGLVEGGADYLLIETCFDTGSLKAGLVAVEQLGRDLGIPIPVVA